MLGLTHQWSRKVNPLTPAPRNFLSGNVYRGMNYLLLRLAARSTPFWLTFAQIELRGGKIIAGEKGIPITFWKSPEKTVEGEPEKRAILRYYRVWNYDQCEGLPPLPEVAPGDGLSPKAAAEAVIKGMPFPVFLTRAVFDAYVAVPEGVTGQDEAGRLWDLVWMLRFAILRSRNGQDRVPVALYVRNDNRRAKLVKLIAQCGAMDIDDPKPAITLHLPDED